MEPTKTSAILLGNRRLNVKVEFKAKDSIITPVKSVKYLGITLDQRLRMRHHVNEVCKKAEKVANALNGVLSNIDGPSDRKRVTVAHCVQSIVLYEAPIWAETLNRKFIKQRLLREQRTIALRICGAYRAVSTQACQVIGSLTPIPLLAKERKLIFEATDRSPISINIEKATKMAHWQSEWVSGDKGRWTNRLIGTIQSWVDRKHGETDHTFTQFLTGHEAFQRYLAKIGKVENKKKLLDL